MRNRFRRALSAFLEAIVFATLFLAFPSPAQQPPSAAEAPAPDQSQAGEKREDKKRAATKDPSGPQQNDRIFWTLPNFLTVENAQDIPPLTTRQKFKVVARGTFDPVEYPYIGFVALIGQAENSKAPYGQGMKGYAKRYGASFSDNTVENFLASAAFPSLLRQDPRYYQLGKGSFFQRAGYAASRVLVIRGDSGHQQFNASELAGSALAATISNLYHPRQDRTVVNNLSVWWTQVGWDAVAFELKEFWPDIRRKVRKK